MTQGIDTGFLVAAEVQEHDPEKHEPEEHKG
jgi:hypothetical protein